jgi:hypothetical protein
VTFSSYALVLMSIGFLQVSLRQELPSIYSSLSLNDRQHRGFLPNLQDGLQELGDNENEGIFWGCSSRNKPLKQCDVRYHNAEGWVTSSEVVVDDLLTEWFR